MSWRDCHFGYCAIGVGLLVASYLAELPILVIAAVLCILNGGYAAMYTPGSNITPAVWWFAIFASSAIYIWFVLLQVMLAVERGRLSWPESLVLAAFTFLSFNQIKFLVRVRRCSGLPQTAVAEDELHS